MKKIVVLAGGNDQIALIKALRKRYDGVEIVLIDFAENPVAKPFADKHLVISTMDQDAVLRATKDENADMIIITCGDQPLPIMAYVAEQLNLPCYLTYEQAMTLTNKQFMKEIMINNDIPTAKHFVVNHKLNESLVSSLSFPLIIKPADCNGSKGVRKVTNLEDLRVYTQQAIEFSRSKTAIIEEFKEGIEVSVDAFVNNGKASVLMTSQLNKHQVNDATMVIYQSVIPAQLSQTVHDKINDIANKIANAYSLTFSPLLIQMIINGEDVSVIEFSARIGGGAKFQTIKEYTGFDILNANIDAMVGKTSEVVFEPSKNIVSRCHLYTVGGIFDKITGLEELIESGIIESYTQTVSSGCKVLAPQGSSNRIGSVLIKASSYDELTSKIKTAISTIKVLDSNGYDILYRTMYEQ